MPAASYSPRSYSAFASALAEEVMVDPLLEVLPHPALPPLIWDVMTHPDHIDLGSAHSPASHRLTQSDLARCAARTSVKDSRLPLRSMVLIIPGVPLEIEVTPSAEPYWSNTPLPFVTVGDVLYSLYKSLRTSVDAREYERLDHRQRDLARRAFEQRLRNDPRNHRRNVQHGIREIDCLGERRMFLGIRPTNGSELPPRRRRGEVFVVELGRTSPRWH
ncbi:hypothetical protein BV20DRAFT_1038704 [Pilatotrama ljubarskyi]|nr:hypothetical protein BV20DRAFT_1038704 [Pilatotrama ljubarskyi]